MRTCRDLKASLKHAERTRAAARAALEREMRAVDKLVKHRAYPQRSIDRDAAYQSGNGPQWGRSATASRLKRAMAERVRRWDSASAKFLNANNEVVNLRDAVASRCKRG